VFFIFFFYSALVANKGLKYDAGEKQHTSSKSEATSIVCHFVSQWNSHWFHSNAQSMNHFYFWRPANNSGNEDRLNKKD